MLAHGGIKRGLFFLSGGVMESLSCCLDLTKVVSLRDSRSHWPVYLPTHTSVGLSPCYK